MNQSLSTSVEQAFNNLLSKLELNPTRVRLASERYAAVKSHLESRLVNVEVKQVGSFRKKTKVRPSDGSDRLDLDVVVCLGNFTGYSNLPGQGIFPVDALNSVQSALKDNVIYRSMRPRVDSPTIILDYSDDFSIELIPCYRDLSGRYSRPSGPACYVVGTNYETWEPADYDFDAEYLTQKNQAVDVGAKLIPTIKMIKVFLRNHSISIKSFFVEINCTQSLPGALGLAKALNVNLGYPRHISFILDKLADNLDRVLMFDGSHTLPVNCGLSDVEQLFTRAKLQRLSTDARNLSNSSSSNILDSWRNFFGSPFP